MRPLLRWAFYDLCVCVSPKVLRYENSRMNAMVERLGAHKIFSLVTEQFAGYINTSCFKYVSAVPEHRDSFNQQNISKCDGAPSHKIGQKDCKRWRLGRMTVEESSGHGRTAVLMTHSSSGCLPRIGALNIPAPRGRGSQGTTPI